MIQLLIAVSLLIPTLALGQLVGGAGTSCINLQKNLYLGSTDVKTKGAVSLLQSFSQEDWEDFGPYFDFEPNGTFDQPTLDAAKECQSEVGLSPTGFGGKQTRAKIRDPSCGAMLTGGSIVPVKVTGGSAATPSPTTTGTSAVLGQPITIYADKNLGAPTLKQGFVSGITYNPSTDYTQTINLISALKPKSWRLGVDDNTVYGFVLIRSNFPLTLGTKITTGPQGWFAWQYRHGWNGIRGEDTPIRMAPACNPTKDEGCFKSFENLKAIWASRTEIWIQGINKYNRVVDYFEPFNEPEDRYHSWRGVSEQQLFELFKIFHDVVRKNRPNAKIIGPSMASYDKNVIGRFLRYVVHNNLRLDGVSWHAYETPNRVPTQANEIREFYEAEPKLCNPTCPEIRIDEYGPGEHHLFSGSGVVWLYYLEKAGVDYASRGCFDVESGGQKWSDCWYGFSGMLLKDNVTPQPLYWAYKAYADMSGVRISSETSDIATVAIASKDDAKKELRILAGKYDVGVKSGPVTIVVNNYPYGGASAKVEISRIPNMGNTPKALPSLPSPEKRTLTINNKVLSITIDNFSSGEAYSIIVTGGSIIATAPPPIPIELGAGTSNNKAVGLNSN